MWSDNDIDNAFHRLNPPEPDPAPFPLDAWLRLEAQLDKVEVKRTVRRKIWKFFAAEVIVVALVGLSWLLWWPAAPAAPAHATAADAAVKASSFAAATPSAAPRAATEVASAAPAVTGAARAAAPASAPPATGSSPASSNASEIAPAETSAAQLPAPRQAERAGESSRPAGRVALGTLATMPQKPRKEHQLADNRARRPALTGVFAGSAAPRESAALATEEVTYSHGRAGISARYGASARKKPSVLAAAGFGAKGADPKSLSTMRPRRSGSGQQPEAGNPSSLSASARGLSTAKIPKPTGETTMAADNAKLAPLPVGLLLATTAGLPAPLSGSVLPAKSDLPVPSKQPRFYVGLVGAPDVTTVKFASVERPLPNVGLTLEYRLTNRLRVNTGLLRSTKAYTARRDDYDWGAYRNLVYQHDFQEVEGACTVLDVPLNLRYDLLVRPRSRMFGSLGLSSFFMQRESYYYEWQANNQTHLWKREAVNENHHLLSILNLSAGYERSLSTRWSLQAEPYLKLPLGGVGAGKVRLISAGVFLGAKYGF